MVSMAGGMHKLRWDVACRPAQLLRGAGASPHVDIVRQASGSSKTGIRRTEIGGFYVLLQVSVPRKKQIDDFFYCGRAMVGRHRNLRNCKS